MTIIRYRKKYSLLLHLDRFYCILQIFNMQKYALKKVSAPVTFLLYLKNTKIFSGKYNLNLKENDLFFFSF